MADSAVAVTAGSGTNIDTRTEATNGHHRQVIVVGDPDTNAGVAPVSATAGLKVDLGADNDVTITSGTVTTVSTVTNVATIGTSVTPGTSAAHLGKAEDAAHASGDTGVAVLAVRRDTAAVGSGTDGDYSTLNVNASGALYTTLQGVTTTTAAPTGSDTALVVGIHPDSVNANGQTTMSASAPVVIASDQSAVQVNPVPATTGGLSIFRSIDLDESEEEVKASAGQVYGMWVSNTATSTRFLKFYNATAANVTVGTTTPVITIPIPGNSSDDVSGLLASAHGIAFGTAITVAATTAVADNDTGAPGANEVIVNIFYK
jgi:hypothetical protein